MQKIDHKLIFSPHTLAHSGNYVEMMGMLIGLVVAILLQCIHISKHYVVHHKNIQFLYVKYTLIKLLKIKK